MINISRHNKVADDIHRTIWVIQVTDKYYEHIPERAINASGTTDGWDVPVITYRTILANRFKRKTKKKTKN